MQIATCNVQTATSKLSQASDWVSLGVRTQPDTAAVKPMGLNQGPLQNVFFSDCKQLVYAIYDLNLIPLFLKLRGGTFPTAPEIDELLSPSK